MTAKSKFDSSKLLKTLTIGHGSILAPHIDAYQSRGKFPPQWTIVIDNSEREEDEYYHPSTDALASPLELYRRKTGVAPQYKISANLRRTFDIGTAWHRYLQLMLIDMGLVTEENVEREYVTSIKTKYGIVGGKGTLDLVDVNIPGHGVWPVVDIKTVNKGMFEGGFDSRTMAKYTAQVNLYLDWVGGSKGLILAICKDSPHEMREYVIQKDQGLVNDIYDRWGYVEECLRIGVAPVPSKVQ